MNLLAGSDHPDLYLWSAVLLAHVAIGLALTGIVAAVLDALDSDDWIDGRGGLAAAIVILGYFAVWEGAGQGYGEGLFGSLVDTVAIAAGALIGLAAWARQGWRVAVGAAVVAAMWVYGKRGRK